MPIPPAMRERVAMIRAVEERVGRPIGVLVDLQGPKLRVGVFRRRRRRSRRGAEFHLRFRSDARRRHARLPAPSGNPCKPCGPAIHLLIDDGKLRLHVVEAAPDSAVATVEVAGRISNRKGVSLPDTEIPVAAMTAKDRVDLEAAVETGVDWIALSFVQRADDVAGGQETRRAAAPWSWPRSKSRRRSRGSTRSCRSPTRLMVARGDLGVEMPLEKVPGLQKRITREARRLGRPVVVATQMLESMITAPAPTRAEVSDVATAVFEGADAIMLSAESASGAYPIEAVAMMNRIAEEVEQDARLSLDHQRPARRARAHRRRRGRRRGARHVGNAGSEGDRRLDVLGRDGLSRRARTARARRFWR